ncbi:GntR family transcriptional regulator [Streptomyces sp. 846.5]|nr:GntR family transcriptional regulator [Streptomyces sp. 846.5]TDU02853.1 GntR family transcriptional regulator [Streptomyces sp. 846.5]
MTRTPPGRPVRSVHLKHERITALLEREIRSGAAAPGEQLPGEMALAKRFGVSRTTVRAALAELNEAGLIATRTGKGSYVLFDGHPLDDRLGWAHALAAQGVDSRTRVLAVTATGDGRLAARLGLELDLFVLVERVRELADGTAVSYERSFLPHVAGVRDLPRDGLGGDSLTAVLALAGLHPDHGEQRLSGRRLDEREATVLRREPGAWFLNTQRTSWTSEGAFAEHVDSLLDPDHFHLSLQFP